MKLKKVEKLVANLHDTTEYVIHIRNIKEGLNHEFVLKNVHRMIKFNQCKTIYLYEHISKKKKSKNDFRKNFLS